MNFYRLIPDRRLDNHGVADLLTAAAGLYEPPFRRWNGRGFDPPQRVAWEVILGRESAAFYLGAPAAWDPVARKQINVVWPKCTVEADQPDPLAGFQPARISRFELKNHAMFPLQMDRRTLGILPSLLECCRTLQADERLAVQILLDPAPPDWWTSLAAAYEEFREGKTPTRFRLDPKELVPKVALGLAWASLEVAGLIGEVVTSFFAGDSAGRLDLAKDLAGPSKALALREAPVGRHVADKIRGDAFDVTIRVAVESPNPEAAKGILRAAAYAFRTLDDDNALVAVDEESSTWGRMTTRTPGMKLAADYLSVREVAMMTQLPTGPLQEEFKLAAVDQVEVNLPAALTKGGMLLGWATYRGKRFPVYMPTDDQDTLCLPACVIGQMGCGKSRGFAANWAAEAVRNGMGAVVIDPAKGEVGDELEAVLGADQVVRIRFGTIPIALDWREAKHSDRARNRLANELVAFVEAAAEEAGAQTVRYLRAAAKAIQDGRLSEIADLMTDKAKALQMIKGMRDQERAVWFPFWDDKQTTPARRTQIASPILNRLDVIQGDDYLAACMDAPDGIDFVKLLEQPRAIVLDLPKADLGAEGVDVLAALLATKLDLAMILRTSKHPVFVLMDEPHQYLRGSRTWKAAAVESRKWRFGYVWLFHSWEQIPKELATIIRSAGPRYHIYTTSPDTYRALAPEIAPLTIDEALGTPRYSALNVIQAEGRRQPAFLAQMTPPPSMRKGDFDRCRQPG